MTADPFYDGLPDDPKPRHAAAGAYIAPVQIEHSQVCVFKKKTCGICDKPQTNKVHRKSIMGEANPDFDHKYVRTNGCAHCDKPKNDPDHGGTPESVNTFLQAGIFEYRTAKSRWHKILAPLLAESGLPRGLGGVLVEGEVSFGDDKPRDQGNHRFIIEKALGDVLVEELYLDSDVWDVYEFGQLVRNDVPGVRRIRLTILPRGPEPEGQGQLIP